MTASTITVRGSDSAVSRSGHDCRLGGGLGVFLAVAATMAIYTVGNLGSPIRVVTGWAPEGTDLTVLEVVATSAAAVTAGAGLLWLLERRRAGHWRLWVTLVGTIAVVSAVPLWRLEVDTGSKVSLTSMHLVTGLAAVAAQWIVRRRFDGTRSGT